MKIKHFLKFLKKIWKVYSEFNYQQVMMMHSYLSIDQKDIETKPQKLKEETSEGADSEVSTHS